MREKKQTIRAKRLLRYTVFFEEAPEGGYVVHIPALGCVTEGDTFEEARRMALDAIRCYCRSLLKCGEPIPEEGPWGAILPLEVSFHESARH